MYKKTKQDEQNFLETNTKTQSVFKNMEGQSLTFEVKIIAFKNLAISKIVYLSMVIKVPAEIMVVLEKLQKRFNWPSKPKIENETISSDFKDGDRQNVDLNKKIASLQCSWIKRLYEDSLYEWKLIPLKLIKNWW